MKPICFALFFALSAYPYETELSVDQVVDKIIRMQKEAVADPKDPDYIFRPSPYWDKKRPIIVAREKIVREKSIRTPSFEASGPLNWLMNRSEMHAAIRDYLRVLRKDGFVLTEQEALAKKLVHTPVEPLKDLTQVFGSHYLTTHRSPQAQYSVRRYYIVIDPNIAQVTLHARTSSGDDRPYPEVFKITGARIFADPIVGTPCKTPLSSTTLWIEKYVLNNDDTVCTTPSSYVLINTYLEKFNRQRDQDLRDYGKYLRQRFLALMGYTIDDMGYINDEFDGYHNKNGALFVVDVNAILEPSMR